MKWLVTGATGMLGRQLVADLRTTGEAVQAAGRADLDVTDPAACVQTVVTARPDVVVNCAAYTAVDAAQTQPARARAVNADGPANLARACLRADAALLHLSTDYVFAGAATSPYGEDEPTAPLSVYGRTKAEGEQRVQALLPARSAIVRTAWLYGPGGTSFVATMLGLQAERDHVDVVDDQRGQPTSTAVVSDALRALAPLVVAGTATGCFHATCAGVTTWFGLAREVFRLVGADPDRVRPTGAAAYARPGSAPRPAYSVLGHRRWAQAGPAGLPEPAPWQQALAQALPAMVASA